MIRRPTLLLLAALLPLLPGSGPVLAEGGAPADNRFFPKEMEDALAALKSPDPEDSFNDGLAVLSRMRSKDGAPDAMRKDAFGPVLEHALSTHLEYVASYAGEILAALDQQRLTAECRSVAEKESDGGRLFNTAVLLEEVPYVADGGSVGDDPVDVLAKIAGKGSEGNRIRALEALGEVATTRRGCPERSREKAVGTLLGAYGAAGKNTDVRNVCAAALGKVGSPKAIPALLNGLYQSEGKHAFFAALALSWIDDPTVFPSVQSANASGGEALEACAKAMEACAREANLDALLGMLAGSGRAEVREAAAVALGRILPTLPAPGPDGKPAGTTPEEKARSELRAKGAQALFDRMVGDPNVRVQWACFHAVSRCGGPWLSDGIMHLLGSPNQGNQIRGLHLAGDFKVKPAAKILMGAVFSVKDDLLRVRCAIDFWRIDDRETIEEFKKRVKESNGGVSLARGCSALGVWRCKEAFELALDLLRATQEGTEDQFQVEIALETMTGHLFGPAPGLWNKWFEKNPNFFSAKQARIEREKWRQEFDKENKGFRQTKETEKAVQMGLEYLARHQDPDGAWDAARFHERCDRNPPCSVSTGARVQEDNVSRTALSILSFLGAGYTPEAGKFKTALRRGLEYLMARQQACGDYLTNDLIGGYDRPVCLQAFAEACALTHDPRYLPFVQRGADFLTQIQNSIGGWRYRVEVETSDSSVASWMLFAMKAAEKAGAQVRPVVFEGTRLLFEKYSQRVPKGGPREEFLDIDPAYGFEVGKDVTYEFQTGYQDKGYSPDHATTAVGLMAHVLLGYRRSHPFCIGSANQILNKLMPEVPKDGSLERIVFRCQYPMYFLYYGTLAMHQMGGKYFRKWNDRLRVILPGLQIQSGCARGSWKGQSLDSAFGALYMTSMGVLALETYYRYLPVLQD
jgi:HEAT repeat protein